MKLISITILVLSFVRNGISNEQFVFPPKFHTAGQFVSDSSLYLPPESHTQIPYYPLKKLNNLQFPYLPPTGTKSPNLYPPPFPIVLSSTLAPNFDDEDDDKGDERDNKILMTSPKPQLQYSNRNRTERVQEDPIVSKRDIRPIPKMFNYQHPIDRIDIKSPPPIPNGFQIPNPNQTSRSMIISAENHRNDFLDQIRSGSSQNPLFISPPGVFISTTEPAIPIVRLSNEMDLDGSFSYEALGADQTHYVQHSHMENLGSDKAEQVVEGSYSYIGDNGQTYTVHYIADSNGFRATGDHLPVAPPIPEIIQRSIQYNLAEEAKKPQHLKSWQSEDQERDYNEINEKNQRYSVPPPRSLFTGRTPEAFSYDFSQRSNIQNNLATAASSQTQMKTIADYNNNQSKINTNGSPILPQVTFLASQGAHIPSMNSLPQSVARMFTTKKSIMPQLMNYEANDGNKALWRWQYGLNSNNVNQSPEKNSISRSFGEGDDVMINFSAMTPDQYSKMLQSQVTTTPKENIHTSRYTENSHNNDDTYTHLHNNPEFIASDNYNNQKYETNKGYTEHETVVASTETVTSQKTLEGWYMPQSETSSPYFYQVGQHGNSKYQNQEIDKDNTNASSKLSSVQNSFSANQVVTQEYNFEDSSYEPKRIKALQPVTMKPYNNNYNQITNSEYHKMITPSYTKVKINEINQESEFAGTHITPTISTESIVRFSDFLTYDNKENFKPVLQRNYENNHDDDDSVSSETIDEYKLNENIFLTKLFNTNKNEQKSFNKIIEEPEKQLLMKNKNNNYGTFNKPEEENNKHLEVHPKKNEPNLHNIIHADEQQYAKVKNAETKSDKIAHVNIQSKPFNEIKSLKKKPLDISDVLNYITMKNHFESSKVRPKKNPTNFGDYNTRNEMHYLPVHEQGNIEDNKVYNQNQNTNNNRPLYPQPGELRGNIKNYKVLQRQNNMVSTGYDNDEIKRELAPPPVKLMQAHNLPPLGRAGPSTRSYLPPTYI